MTAWPKDTQTARNAFYGDPGKGEIDKMLVDVVPPFAMYYEGKRIRAIRFHKKAAAALLAALNEVWDFCEHSQAKVDASGASKYFGAYNHRMVRGSTTKWSNHAYGTAIDLNALENALGQHGNMPAFIVDAFCRQGAMWGGWYKTRPDWMHFEFVDNGGHKPRSAPPAWPKPVALMAEQQPVGEVFEDEPTAPIAGWEPDADAVNDPKVFFVQKRLKAMAISPGLVDGLWGGGTSGALARFINDHSPDLTAPTSVAEFDAAFPTLQPIVQAAFLAGWRPAVTAARATGDAKTVAAIAPEVIPVKRNFLTGVWASCAAFFAALFSAVSNQVTAAYNWFTNNSDSGIVAWVTSHLAMVPIPVWIALGGCALVFFTVNSWSAIKTVKASVASGERL